METESLPEKVRVWEELNMMRWLAASMMVINHFFVEYPGSGTSFLRLFAGLEFVGSFAPVLFFFITGTGYGIRRRTKRSVFNRSFLIKVAVLLLMDFIVRNRWDIRLSFGWDFLAFIAFSMIILAPMRKVSKPGLKLMISALIILTIRYILGPLFRHYTNGTEIYLLEAIFGTAPIIGVSYWFVPWLVFPFLGFIFGRFLSMFENEIEEKKKLFIIVTLSSGLLLLFSSLLLRSRGFILHRWGMVSANYFVASLSCLLLVISTVFLLTSLFSGRIVDSISLRGVSSLSVVPIHYIILDILEYREISIQHNLILIGTLVLLWTSTMVAAKRMEKLFSKISRAIHSVYPILIVLFTTVIVFSASLITSGQPMLIILTFFTSILLCLILEVSNVKLVGRTEVRKTLR